MVGRVAGSLVLVLLVAGGCQETERRPPVVKETGPVTSLRSLIAGRRPVFDEEFDRLWLGRGRRWGWQSGSYSNCATNPGGFKLDLLTPAALSVRGGMLHITATPLPDGRWLAGLLTTGDSCETGGQGFTVRTGDVIVTRARLPQVRTGAWPAIWTWRQGGNEVDVFEWHADRPDTVEFVNHVRGGYRYWSSPLVRRGIWLYFAVHLQPGRNTWYAGPTPTSMRVAHRDRRGVGHRFRAHLVVGLSADDGKLHARPDEDEPLTFTVDYLKVYRKVQQKEK